MADMAVESRLDAGTGGLLSPNVLSFDVKGRPHLLGGHCTACDTRMFPRVQVCPNCMGEEIVEETMPDRGTLYSYTVLHVGPARWDKPITLGYVDLANGVRVFSHLRGKVAMGQEVALSIGVVGHLPDGQEISNFVFSPEVAS